MSEILQVMLWPLVACLTLPILLVYLGLHIVRREIIFVDLGLAQVAALGTCMAILLGHHHRSLEFFSTPLLGKVELSFGYLWSLGFTLVGAALFTLTRSLKRHRVPQEALIGIVYVMAAAAGILLLSRSPEGNEELRKTLIGEVLLVSSKQVVSNILLFVCIALAHFFFRKQFFKLSFEPEKIKTNAAWWDFLFYLLFGMVVTSFVEIGGVLLVFSYLIVPAICANFLAERFGSLLLIGWVVSTLASVTGLFVSYKLDFPTGSAIVCALGALLIVTIVAAHFLPQRSEALTEKAEI